MNSAGACRIREAGSVLECVVNISEGRDPDRIGAIAAAAGDALLDLHTDPDHHRSVLTLLGEDGPRHVAEAAVRLLDLTSHSGAHPRIGVVDVVPFVALDGEHQRGRRGRARPLLHLGRHRPRRALLPLRRRCDRSPTSAAARSTSSCPTADQRHPTRTAGAIAVGARPLLVAYNVWLAEPDLARAKRLAVELRSPSVRALGLQVGDAVQVSMNLVDPLVTGPGAVVDAIARQVAVDRCELVGLVPRAVLEREPAGRWDDLDLSADRTIEARISRSIRR